jgi:hypothetical protein
MKQPGWPSVGAEYSTESGHCQIVGEGLNAFGLAASSAEPGDACLAGSRFSIFGTRASSGFARKEPQCLHGARARRELTSLC